MKKIIFLVLLLSGCATGPATINDRVPLGADVTLTLPKVNELNRKLEVSQMITARYHDQSFTFEGHVSADKDHFLLVGLDSFGRRMMTIDWTPERIKYDAPNWVPKQLRPESVLADIVILYWPENSVRRALGNEAF